MHKRSIIIFFLVLFNSFIITPSIMVVANDSADISMFYNSSEEEEEKSIEKIKSIEEIAQNHTTSTEFLKSSKIKINVRYQLKTYTKPYFNLISPPPDKC